MIYQGLLVDLDNTLYDYDGPHSRAWPRLVDFLAASTGADRARVEGALQRGRAHVNRTLHGTAASHNRLLYIQHALELLGQRPAGLALPAHETYWSTLLSFARLRDGVLPLLQRVSAERVAVVTDLTADVQHRKLAHLGLQDVVGHLVTSEEAGHEKPHPHIFQVALGKLQLRPQDVCMVGDSYEKDIYGAFELGIDAYWFRPGPEPAPRDEAAIDPRVTVFEDFVQLRAMLGA